MQIPERVQPRATPPIAPPFNDNKNSGSSDSGGSDKAKKSPASNQPRSNTHNVANSTTSKTDYSEILKLIRSVNLDTARITSLREYEIAHLRNALKEIGHKLHAIRKNNPEFYQQSMKQAFGDDVDIDEVSKQIDLILKGQSSVKIVFLDLPEGVDGAYSSKNNTIYLSPRLLKDPAKMARVLLEEIAHAGHEMSGAADAEGDEGAIFAEDILSGSLLSEALLQAYRQEDDKGQISVDDLLLDVEFSKDKGRPTTPDRFKAAFAVRENGAISGWVIHASFKSNTKFAIDDAATNPSGASISSEGQMLFNTLKDYDYLQEGQEEEVTIHYTYLENGDTRKGTVTVIITGVDDKATVHDDDITPELDGDDPSYTGSLPQVDDPDLKDTNTYEIEGTPDDDGWVAVEGGFLVKVKNPTTGEYEVRKGPGYKAGTSRKTFSFRYRVKNQNDIPSNWAIVSGRVKAGTAEQTEDQSQAKKTPVSEIGPTGIVSIRLPGSDPEYTSHEPSKGDVKIKNGLLEFSQNGAFASLGKGDSVDIEVKYMATRPGATGPTPHTYILRVNGTNDAPVFSENNYDKNTEDTPVMLGSSMTSFVPSASDVDKGATLRYEFKKPLPSGFASDSNGGSGFTFTPTAAQYPDLEPGEKKKVGVRVRALDEHGQASEWVTVYIWIQKPAVDRSKVKNPKHETDANMPVVKRMPEFKGGKDGDKDHVIKQSPAKGEFVLVDTNNDGIKDSYRFIPGDQFKGLKKDEKSSPIQMTYTYTDSKGKKHTVTVFVTVVGVNDAPVAKDYNHLEEVDSKGGSYAFLLPTSTDADIGDTRTYGIKSQVEPPIYGKVEITDPKTGDAVFKPSAEFDKVPEGETRTITFTYEVKDGSGAVSETKTVTMVIRGRGKPDDNTQPLDTNQQGTVDANSKKHGNISNGGRTSNHEVTKRPSKGKLEVLDDGRWSFEPGSDYAHLKAGEKETVQFEYTAINKQTGKPVRGVVTITITGTNEDPIVVGNTQHNPTANGKYTGQLPHATDPENSKLTWKVKSGPDNGKGEVTLVNGEVIFDPKDDFRHLAAGETEEVKVVVVVEDADGGSEEVTLTFTVTGVDDAPEAQDDDFEVRFERNFEGDVSQNDKKGDGENRYQLASVPLKTSKGGTVTMDENGKFVYTPPPGYDGPDSFDYTVVDADGQTSTGTVDLKVKNEFDSLETEEEIKEYEKKLEFKKLIHELELFAKKIKRDMDRNDKQLLMDNLKRNQELISWFLR